MTMTASSSAASSSRRYLKSCFKYTKITLATIFTASMTAATYYRPIAADYNYDDDASPSLSSSSNNFNNANSNSNNNRRMQQPFCSPTAPPWNREHVPILLQWARSISIGVTTLAIRFVMNTYGRYEIIQDEQYKNFLYAAITARREQQQQQQSFPPRGLLTVSNHRSLFDDPGILSCLLPLPIAVQPHHQRWGICSQEYCFNDALPILCKAYIGAGQVLPICRGNGINQQLLLDFGRHLANGEWCHVFPEGGVWQWKELGGRRELPEGYVLGSASDFAPSTNTHHHQEVDDKKSCGEKEDANNTKNNFTTNVKIDKRDINDSKGSGGNSNSNNKSNIYNHNTNNDTNNNTTTTNKRIIIPATTDHKSLPPSPKGKLKWGVGKLIAHAPITPRVIPFAHCGMEKLLPQDEISGKTYLRTDFLESLVPSFLLLLLGHNISDDEGSSSNDDNGFGQALQVRIQFGHEINFDDLIQEHEDKHGKLWKYRGKEPALATIHGGGEKNSTSTCTPPPAVGTATVPQENWVSSSEERILYSKIVKRIEVHLEVLTKEVCSKQ